ncbi:replication protein, partial [Staphylococcus capitis]|uniref:replication protein n=1 Tax=Staphylococcus capitis TaxID=29388 RepID=UPI000D19FF18
NKQLCSILNYAETKIIKLKKELEKYNLIINERQGLNKPNKIYLLEPSYETELTNSKFRNKEFVSSRTNESLVQELTNSKSNETNLNNTNYIDTDINDLNDVYDKNNIHTNNSNQKEQNFKNAALKFQLLEGLPKQIHSYLENFEFEEIKIIKNILLKGKKSFNEKNNLVYRLEDVEFEVVNVLKRFKAMLIRKNETVKAMQGYLMKSIIAEFEEIHVLRMRQQNISKYSIFHQQY